jgi:hypothetical protein
MITTKQVDDFASLVTTAKPLHASFIKRLLGSIKE